MSCHWILQRNLLHTLANFHCRETGHLVIDATSQRPGRNPAVSREVSVFTEVLERVCVETVEAGHMTKDLALLIGPDAPWLTTTQFLDKLDEGLQAAMA